MDDSSCGLCRVVHRLASYMVGMIQNLGRSISGFNGYFHFIVLKKGDDFFPISIQGATRLLLLRSYQM